MFEPVTIITGFLTMWAQLNNYGIDTEKYPHLKNIRVRRHSPYIQDNTDYNPMADLKDSIIMKNIYSARTKRQAYENMQNNNNNMQNDYGSTIIPLANYPKGSQYYSQNTNGILYHYSPYIGNNRVYNQNNAYNGNNNSPYGTNAISSRLVLKPYGVTDTNGYNNNLQYNGNNGVNNGNNNLNNVNNNGWNNGNNNGLNNGNNNLNNGNNNVKPKRRRIHNETILSGSFVGSSWCPEFLHSVKVGGVSACVEDNDDYA